MNIIKIYIKNLLYLLKFFLNKKFKIIIKGKI